MSRPISIRIPHALDRVEARKRIDEGFGSLEQQMGAGSLARVERRWEGDRLLFNARAIGQSLRGRLDVLDQEVTIELDLPPMLAAIAGRLSGQLQKQTQRLLEKK